jgi:hypothetical protein
MYSECMDSRVVLYANVGIHRRDTQSYKPRDLPGYNQRAMPIAGAGHQASFPRETVVTVLLASGSLATVGAVVLVLWGLCAWKG